jgi:NAD(P)-dependent dehydrogenase (short-subunit alcohol dehydrogenase family)
MSFDPRYAIVTASDSGIGKATAVALAQNGMDIGITWHSDSEGAEATAEEVRSHGRKALVKQLDTTDLPSCAITIDLLIDELGGLDVFVNNAGGAPGHAFLEYPLEDFRDALDVNLTGAFVCGQRAARIMVENGAPGRVVNITSVHEHIPLRGAAGYCAAKGGLGLLTKVMALELAEYGITVNAVAPGEIATPMTGADDEEPRTLERPMLPADRPGHAHEIAAIVAYLASPDARYATGSSFVVDGGLMLMAAEANRAAPPY